RARRAGRPLQRAGGRPEFRSPDRPLRRARALEPRALWHGRCCRGERLLGAPEIGPPRPAASSHRVPTWLLRRASTLITRNLARGGDGGQRADGGDGLGGGLFSDGSSVLTVSTSTVTRNRAQGGHGKAGG